MCKINQRICRVIYSLVFNIYLTKLSAVFIYGNIGIGLYGCDKIDPGMTLPQVGALYHKTILCLVLNPVDVIINVTD